MSLLSICTYYFFNSINALAAKKCTGIMAALNKTILLFLVVALVITFCTDNVAAGRRGHVKHCDKYCHKSIDLRNKCCRKNGYHHYDTCDRHNYLYCEGNQF